MYGRLVWKINIPKLPPKFIKIRQHTKINVDIFILTTTALLSLLMTCFQRLILVIFINLKKASDLVDHYLLLDKLHAVGLSQNALL